jgi:hypothetical protein
MDPIPASIPFHVARAYGVAQRPATQVEPKPPAGAANKNADLVAAIVDGPVRFNVSESDAPASTKTGESFQLYRHPADKNAAATALSSGRALDTKA